MLIRHGEMPNPDMETFVLRKHSNHTIELSDWGMLANGSSGWLEIERAWLREVQAIYEIFCEKQHDYGPKNIGIGGLPGLLTRMIDKVARWNEYIKKGAYKVPGESLEDTLQDIADYGVIALLVLHGHWPTFELADLLDDDDEDVTNS